MIVVDASVLVDVLVRAPDVQAVEERLFSDTAWNAPHLIDLEIAQVLRRRALAEPADAERAGQALAVLEDLPLHRWPHRALLPRVWSLRMSLTAYDAAYVALAEALECELLTRDARLSRSRGHRARVALIKPFEP